jgi:hypothetical protein
VYIILSIRYCCMFFFCFFFPIVFFVGMDVCVLQCVVFVYYGWLYIYLSFSFAVFFFLSLVLSNSSVLIYQTLPHSTQNNICIILLSIRRLLSLRLIFYSIFNCVDWEFNTITSNLSFQMSLVVCNISRSLLLLIFYNQTTIFSFLSCWYPSPYNFFSADCFDSESFPSPRRGISYLDSSILCNSWY